MAGPAKQARSEARRQAIITAALEVIGKRGVHSSTHRAIATAAKVPLGSLTYYFSNLEEILEAAFERFYTAMATEMREKLAGADSPQQAADLVTDLICGETYQQLGEGTVLYEFYAYGNFNEVVRGYRSDWLRVSHETLTQWFTPGTAKAVDALIEGFTMHRTFHRDWVSAAEVRAAIHALLSSQAAR